MDLLLLIALLKKHVITQQLEAHNLLTYLLAHDIYIYNITW